MASGNQMLDIGVYIGVVIGIIITLGVQVMIKEYRESKKTFVMKSAIPDISERSYDRRKFPVMYAQEDFTYGGYFYMKNDEISVYHHNYSTLVKWMKENKININKVYQMKNSPCLK